MRKITLCLLCVFIVLTFCFYSFCATDVDYYSSIYVYQSNLSTTSMSFPALPSGSYDLSKGFLFYGSTPILFLPDIDASGINSYSGYINYGTTRQGYKKIDNLTNIAYNYFTLDQVNNTTYWSYSGVLSSNSTYYFGVYDPYYNFTPVSYCGADVLMTYDGGAIVFANYDSATLNIISSSFEVANAQGSFNLIFSNAYLDIGYTDHLSYVQVSYNENNTWVDGETVILTNNSSLFNSTTNSFYVPLNNLIDRDLNVNDQFKITYGWTVLDRLGNYHSYDFYNIYTRGSAYSSSGYTPAPEPGSGSGGEGDSSSPDYTNTLNDMQSSIDNQTNAINQQTNSINNLNDNIMNQNTTDPSSIDIQDNTQNNTADLSSLFSSIQSAFTTRDSNDKTFPLTLPNGDVYYFSFPKTFIRTFITSNNVLYTFVSAFWYVVFGAYIIFDMKKMYNKFKNGDFEGAMNSSSVDNVVKEALR